MSVTTISPGLTESEFHETADHIKPSYMKAVTMSARDVAEIGIHAALRGRAHVTPGAPNILMGWWMKWLPRSLATMVAGLSMLDARTKQKPAPKARAERAASEGAVQLETRESAQA